MMLFEVVTIRSHKLLSRAREYVALHGISDSYKDYLSIIKNQGNEGLCWAYSLTSAIEMKYAVKTGNRLALDPSTIYNNSANWWKSHYSKDSNYDFCRKYIDKGYNPYCALGFMVESGTSMIQMDQKDSHVSINNAEVVTITSLKELYSLLDKHSILYSGINADILSKEAQVIIDYVETDEINHAIVITSVGKLTGFDGIYVEILNSWGYDGLIYIKVADNESDILHNNLKLFDFNSWIQVDSIDYTNTIILALMITFVVLFLISLVIVIILLAILFRGHTKNNKEYQVSESNQSTNGLETQLTP